MVRISMAIFFSSWVSSELQKPFDLQQQFDGVHAVELVGFAKIVIEAGMVDLELALEDVRGFPSVISSLVIGFLLLFRTFPSI